MPHTASMWTPRQQVRQSRVVFAYNERKKRTLEIFQRAYPDSIRPEAYAVKLGRYPTRAAYSYLLKLWQWGLLSRQTGPVRYRITQKGRRRLAWLRR